MDSVHVEHESPSGFYDRRALKFDSQRFACWCGSNLAEWEELLVKEGIRPEGYILDLGSGTGRFAVSLAEAGGRVITVDASKNMVHLARERARGLSLDPAMDFVVADAERLPFKNASVKNIVSIRMLSHYAEIRHILREISRVLTGGGVVILDAPSPLAPLLAGLIGLYDSKGIESYEDFYHPPSRLGKALRGVGIDALSVISYAALPPSLVHRLFCSSNRSISKSLAVALLRIRPGMLKLVRGVKRR